MTKIYLITTKADIEAREEELLEYSIDYLIVDRIRSFFGIVDGLTVDAVCIPKIAVGKGMRIKKWFVKVLKEGKKAISFFVVALLNYRPRIEQLSQGGEERAFEALA